MEVHTYFITMHTPKIGINVIFLVADGPHENYRCFICCILTHGNYGTLNAKDDSYEIDDILSLFYDKWNGKPKIYFIQVIIYL